MVINDKLGKIYDAIYYGIMYFSYDNIKNKCKENQQDMESAFRYFNEIKSQMQPLPNCLKLLFKYDGMSTCIASEFFRRKVDINVDDLHIFTEKVNSYARLKKFVLGLLFPNLSNEVVDKLVNNTDNDLIIQTIEQYITDNNMAYETFVFIMKFDYVKEMFVQFLLEITPLIENLHKQYESEILNAFTLMQSDAYISLYNKILRINKEEMESVIVSYCLLNQYVCLHSINVEKPDFLVVGIRDYELIYKVLVCSNVRLEDFILACNEPLKLHIVQALMKNNELTINELAKMLNAPNANLLRCVMDLFRNCLVITSEEDEKQIYYKINDAYMRQVKKTSVQFFKAY